MRVCGLNEYELGQRAKKKKRKNTLKQLYKQLFSLFYIKIEDITILINLLILLYYYYKLKYIKNQYIHIY